MFEIGDKVIYRKFRYSSSTKVRAIPGVVVGVRPKRLAHGDYKVQIKYIKSETQDIIATSWVESSNLEYRNERADIDADKK